VPDYAQWLGNQKDTDPNVRELKAFAMAHPAEWPTASNVLSDYLSVVSAEPTQSQRDRLLATLGQTYERWSHQERAPRLHPGTIALFVAGVVIAATIVTVFSSIPAFLPSLAKQTMHAALLPSYLRSAPSPLWFWWPSHYFG
jgi:hypothetical protein